MIGSQKKLIFFMPFIGGGGVEKNLYIIANYLARKFNKVRICTISTNQRKKFDQKIKFLSPKKKVSENINIRFKYLISLFILLTYLIKNKNSVVFAFQANIYCILICKILNVKIIVRSNSSPSGWYHNFLKKYFYKKIINLADTVIVNSLEFKKEMEKRFKIKTICIYNPLNTKEIIRKSKIKSRNIFFKNKKNYLKIINVGRLTLQKDQMTLLRAIKILKKKINLKLLILGRGIEKKNLQNYINENDLKSNIKIQNFIENPYNLINQSDIFILTSKYEGLPNVLLEAALLKKLIISTNCPTGPKEILSNGKGGILFKVGDYNELVKKVYYYINNKKKLQKKVSYSFKSLNRFDYKRNLNNYYLLVKKYLLIN